MLCHQHSREPLCRVCLHDCPTLDFATCQHNLLNRLSVAQQLEHTYIDELLACSPYQWPVSQLLTRLKFGHNGVYARPLIKLMSATLSAQLIDKPELLVPVPLSRARFARRGFNQAYLLAQGLGKALSIPVASNLVAKRSHTPPQTELDGKARRANVRHAYRVTNCPKAKHIAIVDDVVTTGATVNAVARVLKQSGNVARIDVWAASISLPP